MQSLAPVSSITYNGGTIPITCGSCSPTALSAGDFMMGALLLAYIPGMGCAVGRYDIGEPCFSPNTSQGYTSLASATPCTVCSAVTATWTVGGTNAELEFN